MDVGVNQPLVMDNGTGVMKADFAGESKPSCMFASCVGRLKHKRTMMQASALDGSAVVGKLAQEHRGVLKISYPMQHGLVENWKDMELVWEHVYSKENLNVPSEEHPVMLTEAALNSARNRERSMEVFFESFNVPSFYLSPQATLSLYAAGKTTGVVMDSGDGVTHVVPVYEGFALPHAITRADFAGRDVTDRLMTLLRESGTVFHTSAEREIVRTIKEQHCQVFRKNASGGFEQADETATEGTCTLPDGQQIKLGSERYLAPEIMFDPSLAGLEYPAVHECLAQSIFRSDLDIRKALFADIILAGGNTKIPNFGLRLASELRALVQRAAYGSIRICVRAAANRELLPWLGGSILASLGSFKEMWIRRSEYEESGSSVLYDRKGMF